MSKGLLITFEGTDGVGKSTQARLLGRWLKSRGKSVVMTREPGGGPVAEKIRRVLLHPSSKMSSLAELFLYEAARADHVHRIVRPALARGQWVLCDRFTDATVAYQGAARGLSLTTIRRLNGIATQKIKPRLTLWLDLPPSDGLAKAIHKKGHADRLELEGLAFQRSVRTGYAAIAAREPRRFKRVAVAASVLETQKKIREIVGKILRP